MYSPFFILYDWAKRSAEARSFHLSGVALDFFQHPVADDLINLLPVDLVEDFMSAQGEQTQGHVRHSGLPEGPGGSADTLAVGAHRVLSADTNSTGRALFIFARLCFCSTY